MKTVAVLLDSWTYAILTSREKSRIRGGRRQRCLLRNYSGSYLNQPVRLRHTCSINGSRLRCLTSNHAVLAHLFGRSNAAKLLSMAGP